RECRMLEPILANTLMGHDQVNGQRRVKAYSEHASSRRRLRRSGDRGTVASITGAARYKKRSTHKERTQFKTGKKYQIPSRLLSCVKFRLGPVDAVTLTWLRIEVLDSAATSQINSLKHGLNWIASGNFNILHNSLSNLFKFVSLSMYSFEFYVLVLTFWFARHGLYDVASIVVII
ncbi:hypothetical protein HID58_062913, partial [Brassica napus]